MKKFALSFSFILLLWLQAVETFSNPADPSVRRTFTLPDGRTVEAMLAGDEFLSYWRLNDGSGLCFTEWKSGGELTLVPVDSMKARRKAMRLNRQLSPIARQRRLPLSVLQGKRRVPVIMVQFSDVKFQTSSTPAFFNRHFNEPGFSHGKQNGSVRDYFLTQSNGKLDLQFDVYGPVTLLKKQGYYGEDEGTNKQKNMAQLLTEAVALADKDIDFSLYDWDGDGQVEQFVIIYAGLGQAEGGGTETIWAHKSSMATEIHDGVVVSDYCCNPELRMIDQKQLVGGIGTVCHEFSHCLGLPDMYDLDDVNYGTKYWDIMGTGVHNNNGFTPAGYTGYDKMALGWQQPVVLEKSGHVAGQKPMSEGGEFYMIRNDNHPDEYYLLENRQQTGWDAAIPGTGLLVMHIDYDPAFFNNPNQTETTNNTHQRCAIILADDDETIDYKNYYNWLEDLRGDLYGYKNHELTDESTPAATLYNMNIDGSKFMGKPVTNIFEADDKTVSFDFENKVASQDIYMLGADNVKIKFTSSSAISLTATIKNFSSKTYSRMVAAYVYGDGAWRANASKTVSVASQQSEEITISLQGLQNDIVYYVALYYFEDDTTNEWKRMTEFKQFKMNDRNNVNISTVGPPEINITSETSATVDVVLHNESMTSFNNTVAAYLWTGSGWHSENRQLTQTIKAYGDKKYHFEFSTLNPQTAYQLYLFYYHETNDGTNPWKQIGDTSMLFTGRKANQHKEGDVNGDGTVDVADIASIISVMAGETSVSFEKADVNSDGFVDVADIAFVIDIMAANARRL